MGVLFTRPVGNIACLIQCKLPITGKNANDAYKFAYIYLQCNQSTMYDVNLLLIIPITYAVHTLPPIMFFEENEEMAEVFLNWANFA